MTERFFRVIEKVTAVTRPPQRAGAGGANPGRMHIAQALTETGQAIQRACPGCTGQGPFVLQPFRQADRLLETVDNGELAVPQLADDHVKTVGTEIDGSEYFRDGIVARFRR